MFSRETDNQSLVIVCNQLNPGYLSVFGKIHFKKYNLQAQKNPLLEEDFRVN